MSLRAILALIFVQLVAAQARGVDTTRRVALFLIEEDTALNARLSAELRSQGFEPVEVSLPVGGGDPFATLFDAMRATHAKRALRVESSARSIRMWIANLATGKQIYRELPRGPQSGDAAIVSLWAVEALRASAVAAEPLPPATIVEVRPLAAPSAPPVRAPTIALQLATAALISPGGVRPSLQLLTGIGWLFARPLGAELFVVLPLLPTRLERPSGSTKIAIGLLAAGPVLALARTSAATRWSGQLSVGGALTLVRARGVGAADYRGKTEHVIGGGPYARAGIALRLWRALRLRADAMAGAVFPKPAIYFVERRVADWGHPWLMGAFGLEATF